MTKADFLMWLVSVLNDLAAGQARLGADFEAVWDDNVDVLYQN